MLTKKKTLQFQFLENKNRNYFSNVIPMRLFGKIVTGHLIFIIMILNSLKRSICHARPCGKTSMTISTLSAVSVLKLSCTALWEDTNDRRTHERSHTCETRLAPFDSVSAVPFSATSASMSVKVFLSVSLIFGDLYVVKIDVRLQRFGLMSVLYCLLKTPFIVVFFEMSSKK